MSKRYAGGCLCGNVRFEAVGPAANPHICSCATCQQHTGSLTVAWVEFAAENMSWIGPGGAPSTWRSSNFSSRAFCPTCGSTIGAIDDEPVIALVLGVFDQPGDKDLIPDGHAFPDGCPKWWSVNISADGIETPRPRTVQDP